MHCGGTAYYRVDGHRRVNENPYLSLGNIYQFAQNLYVEVDADNTVTITRLDALHGTTIGEPWVVGPGRRNVYTEDRYEEAKPCHFAENVSLTVEASGEDAVKVTFDGATMGDAGPALYYNISLMQKDESGKYVAVQTADLGSRQVFYPNDEGIPAGLYRHTFHGVDLSDYGIVVRAYDCWQPSDNVLVYSSGNYVYGDGNVAYGKRVTVTKGAFRIGHSEYSPAMLTDGLFGYTSNNPERLRGWDKADDFVISEENPIDITIHLGDTYQMTSVILHPIVTYTNAFPTYFEFQVSITDDGDDWVTVKANVDVVCDGRHSGSDPFEAYDPDNYYKVTFDTPIPVRRFRIHITEQSPLPHGEGNCYMRFGELEIWE